MVETKLMKAEPCRENILAEVKREVDLIVNEFEDKPKLVVIRSGNDPASETYVRNKILTCNGVGIESVEKHFSQRIERNRLEDLIGELNQDRSVNGILVQLPIENFTKDEESTVLNDISPLKDVDGFTQTNLDKLLVGESCFEPCTPKGIVELLNYYKVDLEGKRIVIAGSSKVVGTPLSYMLLEKGFKVHLQNHESPNREAEIKQADVFISAIGKKPQYFNDPNKIKEGAVLIDVGFHRLELDGNIKYFGDMDHSKFEGIASYITPVLGGVGPMTVAMLMRNTVDAYKQQNGID